MKCNAVIQTRRAVWATGELEEQDQGEEARTNVSGSKNDTGSAHVKNNKLGACWTWVRLECHSSFRDD